MKRLLWKELGRVFPLRLCILVLAAIIAYSGFATFQSIQRYDASNSSGSLIHGSENLERAQADISDGLLTSEYLQELIRDPASTGSIKRTKIEDISLSCYGKPIDALSVEEMEGFYGARLEQIDTMLQAHPYQNYSDAERETILAEAALIPNPLPMGYSEGWIRLTSDMGGFLCYLLIAIGLTVIPLFGNDSQTGMDMLCRSTKYGTTKLNHTRILCAYLMGVGIYLAGVAVYTVVKMIPYGWAGWDLPIQNSANYFMSASNICFAQMFVLNILFGLLAALLAISVALLSSVLTQSTMMGTIAYGMFWLLLFSFDQMVLYPINHSFANFMPLRMTSFAHYYIDNELYRVLGFGIDCEIWIGCIASLLSICICIFSVLFSDARTGHKCFHNVPARRI